TSMKEDDLLFKANSAKFELDENSIKSEMFDKTSLCITLLCFLSSKNVNLFKTVEQLSKWQRTNSIWTIIEETDHKNYCKICQDEYLKNTKLVKLNLILKLSIQKLE
ncbi:11742_t:CDS:1, partial [Gigaspora margarita]